MTRSKILVVDDEIIIAREIEARLLSMGYDVPALASSGAEALEASHRYTPDLVLMDIALKGATDGIETATEIRRLFKTPIIFVTAYADDRTLERAKVTEPSGYIVKPFSERELRANIEMALYRNSMERRLCKVEQWFSESITRLTDAVITTDADGLVATLNVAAHQLLGMTSQNAIAAVGVPLEVAIGLKQRRGGEAEFARNVLRHGMSVESPEETAIQHPAQGAIAVQILASPLRLADGSLSGVIVVLRRPALARAATVSE